MKPRDTTRLDPDNWVDAYGEALFGFALARVKNSDVAQDLVQETYTAALRSRRSFRGTSSEKTWLFGILKHKVFDYFGSTRRIRYGDDGPPNPDDIEQFLRTRGGGWIYPPGSQPILKRLTTIGNSWTTWAAVWHTCPKGRRRCSSIVKSTV